MRIDALNLESHQSESPPHAVAAQAHAAVPEFWPRKYDLFGVGVSATTYAEATAAILHAAEERASAAVSAHAVHALMTFAGSPAMRAKANSFEMITPDGQPVRWALNLLHGAKLKQRVYGPHLTLHVCHAAAERGVPIFLYGGANDEVLQKLIAALTERFPRLKIAGAVSPPFRPLTADEAETLVQTIQASGAGIVFIGLGCPKQDEFAVAFRERLAAVLICVGAAFDFHAGIKPQAPRWMQGWGLEWLYRLGQEPHRLWKRYLVTNSTYLAKLARSLARKWLMPWRPPTQFARQRIVAEPVQPEQKRAPPRESSLSETVVMHAEETVRTNAAEARPHAEEAGLNARPRNAIP